MYRASGQKPVKQMEPANEQDVANDYVDVAASDDNQDQLEDEDQISEVEAPRSTRG